MSRSLKRCSLLLAACCLLPAAFALSGERIPFSMHAAPPVVSQGGKSKPAFSMHAAEEAQPVSATNSIAFSVHDAKALDQKPEGDAPKPDCSPIRTANRVLVIHPATQTVKVKVCDDFGCRFELRTVPHPILAELKKLTPKWSFGDKECDHFRPINADDPKQAELLRELQVKREDLPLLVKETDVEKRKKAAGMSGEDLAKQWNKWFLAPEAEPPSAADKPVQKCLPSFQVSGVQWTWPGGIRSHLTDPRQVHHLPKAVVDTWTDQQCVAWHNWHHEVLSGRRSTAVPAVPSQKTSAVFSHGSQRAGTLEDRIAAIARSKIRLPPPQMVAAANIRDGHSSDARKAKKKRSTLSRNGSLTSVAACARRLLGKSSPSIRSVCSTPSRCSRSLA